MTTAATFTALWQAKTEAQKRVGPTRQVAIDTDGGKVFVGFWKPRAKGGADFDCHAVLPSYAAAIAHLATVAA